MTRRRLLLGGLGLGAAAAATGAGMITDVLPGGPPLRRAIGMTGPDGTIPDVAPAPVTTQRRYSTARGRDVDLVTIGPAGLPVCLALHGRYSNAREFIDLGLPQFLTAAGSPFAIAAVDCGDNYFTPRNGDDPLRMLTDELPTWLGAAPKAAIGLSMGCFGALCLARRQPLQAVAVASPALFRDWPDAKSRNAFADERQWIEQEPLHHTEELAGTPLGVWCGTEDPFIDAARDLIDKAHPEVAAIDRGDHNDGYWLRVLPDLLRFVGTQLSRS